MSWKLHFKSAPVMQRGSREQRGRRRRNSKRTFLWTGVIYKPLLFNQRKNCWQHTVCMPWLACCQSNFSLLDSLPTQKVSFVLFEGQEGVFWTDPPNFLHTERAVPSLECRHFFSSLVARIAKCRWNLCSTVSRTVLRSKCLARA